MKNENVNNYSDFKVDKENESVSYNDEAHKYWVKSLGLDCISVTTLIHKFTTFDEDFWSAYKALESLVDPETFKEVKSNLLDTKRFNQTHLSMTGVDEEDFNERRQEILNEWAEKRETSCLRGSAIHKEHELLHLAGSTKELQHLGLGGKFKPVTTNKIELGNQRVYPELLLSRISEDGKFRIAGQADLVIIDGQDVYILDYKTNREIKKTSYFDRKTKKSQMMKYPLNNIQDTNFWHYTLQLSTYAWMIEKQCPGVVIKSLVLIHYDHEGGCTTYECEYLKKDVEKMLLYYRKQLEYDEFMALRRKVEF